MAGRALRKGALSQGLFTSWLEELAAFMSPEQQKPKKLSKRLTKRAQKSRDEACMIVNDFCQEYHAARVEPTLAEIEALWGRCCYYRSPCMAASFCEQLSLLDGGMEWQPRLRALCALEQCFSEESIAPRPIAVKVYEEAEDLLLYLARDVPQCASRAQRIIELARRPPPRLALAPRDLLKSRAESTTNPAGEQQCNDAEEMGSSFTAGVHFDELEGQGNGYRQTAQDVQPDKEVGDANDSETTASSCEEETKHSVTTCSDARVPKDAVEDAEAIAPWPAVAADFQCSHSPARGRQPSSLEGSVAEIDIHPSFTANVQSVASQLAPSEWASNQSDASDDQVPVTAASTVGQASMPQRPFLWLAAVEAATHDHETWVDPLASLNPSDLRQLQDRKVQVVPL
eukprot:TRINITY_DN75721_c0_g1_i1.p1 TRINITY_DN75721_c0_g1~~TRINITY_DN75721_c0_g1_i1.p1  ORF type:complete len:400 (-),score=79.64 TRINITY_DN75721_c0_g1_i1:96-1295(-)